MEEEVRDAVFGNVGTTVVFRVGPFDAEVLETVFAPKFMKEDIVTLDKRQVYLSLMIDGVGSAPFSAVTIPPIEPPPVSLRKAIIESSRAQFAAPRAGIESSIMEELAASAAAPAPSDARMSRFGPPKRPPSEVKRTAAPKTTPHPTSVPQEKEPTARAMDAVHENPRPLPPVVHSRPDLPKREEHHERKQPTGERTEPAPLASHPVKNPEDLKTILRTMTAKTTIEDAHKKSQNQASLKGALARVLAKNSAAPVAPVMPQKTEQSVAPQPIAEEGKQKPFEVPEDTLRKVLKGEDPS